ncbi:hypothetical protein ACHAWO_010324 [Cyclotella atomus]|uniref:Uncharacterized protein n=1 Tax=Cyclotella atomus TaxID=382360 RepID=A0ABD3QEQ4_9STRA
MTNTNTSRMNVASKSSERMPRRRRVTVSGPCTSPSLPPVDRPRRRYSLPNLKQVQFSDVSEVCVLDRQLITTTKDWYTLQDQESFKKERIIDLMTLRMPKNKPPRRASCPVGLEQFLSSKNRQESKENRKMVIHVVLSEQKRQRAMCVVDQERLALLASTNTSDELVKAVKRGKFQAMARFID